MDFDGKTISELAKGLVDIPFFASLKPENLLKEIPLFADLSDAALRSLAEKVQLIEAAPGGVICRQGEYDTSLYVILSGLAEATARTDANAKVELATYGPGTFFGRTDVRSDAPNAYTVTARERAVLLSIPGERFTALVEESAELGAMLAYTHRRRAVRYGLRLVPFFSRFSERGLDELGRRGKVREYGRGEVIFKQGEEGDSLHLVLSGIVKVVIEGGEEKILAYLKRGACFGEMALVKNEKRMASVVAVNPTQTLQIMKDAFEGFLAAHSDIAAKIRRTIAEREAENIELEKDPERAERLKFMEGLIDSSEVLIIDLNRCIRCDNCVEACRVVRGSARLRREGERFADYVIATACRQCRDPACMLCPRGAISRDKHGEIHFGENCVGCGFCAKKCPFGNISIVEVGAEEETGKKIRKAVKCDLCRDRPYAPCVYNCPTGALQRVSPGVLFAKVTVKK
ncbi:MAG: cyclic nucleotide-binding domain-containing protein [Planctomycetes bacterium]|nr:cyclic nucleotide-binding domain-containing protein [Planctomycetota bacterium]